MELVATRTILQSVSKSDGFGLIGMVLLIMITITSIFITSMLVPAMSNRQIKETEAKGKALKAAIAAFKANSASSSYPLSLSALVTTDGNTCTTTGSGTSMALQGWCGPYMDQIIVENASDYQTDGWGTTFQYSSTTGVVTSCGPDRTCGDSDDITFN
jgi:type II secretory pathway pseudopilin PulG